MGNDQKATSRPKFLRAIQGIITSESLWRTLTIQLVSVLLALLIGAIIILISGADPLRAYGALFQGSLGSVTALGRTLEKATPLIFSGLAVAFAFKAGLFNIGAQGQLLFGAITAAAIGFGIKGLPSFIHAPLALIGGALAGGLYAAIPGVLKAYRGAHEVIVTIMLNYIAINITDYLSDGPWKDTSPGNIVARTPEILDTARVPNLAGIPLGFFVAVLVAIVVWWLLWKTTIGFEIRTVGLNPNAARYAGIKVAQTYPHHGVGGLLAGMGGAVETQGWSTVTSQALISVWALTASPLPCSARPTPLASSAALLVGAMKAGLARCVRFRRRQGDLPISSRRSSSSSSPPM
jgi:simple sugar transport system permease protein